MYPLFFIPSLIILMVITIYQCSLNITVTFGSSALWNCTSRKIFRESFGVIHSLLSGRVGVQVSPHVLDLQLQIQLGALPGALSHTYTQVNKPWHRFCITEDKTYNTLFIYKS